MEPEPMAAAAALARIEEVRSQMTTDQASREEAATVARTIWALGDYHRFAKELFWELGPVLVEASGISRGDRVLDVAAGTGNVALRAAELGAEVVALDITPESLAAGRREAESLDLSLEWVEGDAQELPFEDASFDVVTSSAGAMFAPDHQAVADEMLRVCRPGGTIGLITFANEGMSAAFFALIGACAGRAPSDRLGRRRPRARALRRPGFGRARAQAVRGAALRRVAHASRLRRLLQGDLRANRRRLRELG
jgi:SAM-dependent methyltransferase